MTDEPWSITPDPDTRMFIVRDESLGGTLVLSAYDMLRLAHRMHTVASAHQEWMEL